MADDAFPLGTLGGKELQTSINTDEEQQTSNAEQSGVHTTPPLPISQLSANENGVQTTPPLPTPQLSANESGAQTTPSLLTSQLSANESGAQTTPPLPTPQLSANESGAQTTPPLPTPQLSANESGVQTTPPLPTPQLSANESGAQTTPPLPTPQLSANESGAQTTPPLPTPQLSANESGAQTTTRLSTPQLSANESRAQTTPPLPTPQLSTNESGAQTTPPLPTPQLSTNESGAQTTPPLPTPQLSTNESGAQTTPPLPTPQLSTNESGAQTTPPLPTHPLLPNQHTQSVPTQQARTNQSTHSEDLTSHVEGNDATRSADAKPDSRCCVMLYCKFLVYLLKIVLIIFQLWQFGKQRSEIVDFFDRTDKTLDHLLLKGWDASYETMPYPPTTGEFAVYTVNDLLDHVQYTWEQYYSLSHISLASINPLIDNSTGQPIPIRLCNSFNNYVDFHNGSYMVMPGVESYCTDLEPLEGQDKYDIRTFLRHRNLTITFPKLVKMTMDFSFTTFHLNMVNTNWGPTCYKLNATICYSNYKRSGQLQISLITHNRERTCTGRIMSQGAKDEEDLERTRSMCIDGFVIACCILSLALCLVFPYRRKAKMLRLYDCKKSIKDMNPWYILITVNDVCTIAGSGIKIRLEMRNISSSSENFNTCSILLGLGVLLACTGLLRYLNVFKGCSVLIHTLQSALPDALRFGLCACVVYVGFLLCGWLVLAPYNVKFRELAMSSECLFALLNGDELFVTFSATQTENQSVWYFSRFYLYAFNFLFIFCVLSVFISIFTRTYETLQGQNVDGENGCHYCQELKRRLPTGCRCKHRVSACCPKWTQCFSPCCFSRCRTDYDEIN